MDHYKKDEERRGLIQNEELNDDFSRLDVKIVNGVEESSTDSSYRSELTPNANSCTTPIKDIQKDLPRSIKWYKLFQFATKGDILICIIGGISAILTGFGYPISNYYFGKLTAAMVEHSSRYANSTDCIPRLSNTTSELMKQAEINAVVGGGLVGVWWFIFGYLMVYCFNSVAEKQIYKIRIQYFRSLICQNLGWFDTNAKMDFSNRIIDDMGKVQEAINETTMGYAIHSFASMIIFSALCFFSGWKLSTLMSFSVAPIAILTYFEGSVSSSLTSKEQDAYADAGAVADEVLTNIRTVVAFGGEEKEIIRYETNLAKAKKFLTRKSIILGLLNGFDYFLCYANFSICFWYGTKLLLESRESGDDLYNAGVIVFICFGMQAVGWHIGRFAEHYKTFGKGMGASREIFNIFDRISEIDPFSNCGQIPTKRAAGNIEFDKVEFSYPSRPDVQILNELSLNINSGQTVAIVGNSGCGKTTCIQLLQRFYDPLGGQIRLDGVNIKDLNIEWLRSQMGVVSQEPVLFNCSILENIAMGQRGATKNEVRQAAFQAYAHDFISKLPKGYDTIAGERGTALSGGQKQRIAIARALIRNPAILLLDEATSALDMQSEAIVQAALERARHGRTTIIVAHRFSTIRAADIVVVIKDGQVAEIGSHNVLMEKKGIYYQLVLRQVDKEATNESGKPIPTEEEIEPILSEIDCDLDLQNFQKDSLDPNEENTHLLKNFSLMRLIKLTSKELPYTFLTLLCTLVKGSFFPVYAIAFGNILGTYISKDNQHIQDQGNFYALVFVLLAAIVGFAAFFQHFFQTKSGDAFTLRIRKLIFQLLLKEDMSFYDERENTVGNLCARMSTDATSIQGATGDRLVQLLQTLTMVGVSTGIGFYFLPKMALACSIFLPVSFLSAFLEGKYLDDENIEEKVAVESAANVGVEALNNIKLVASFGLEEHFLEAFIKELAKSHKINLVRSRVRALAYSFTLSLPFVAFGLSLWYGIYLVEQECANVADIWKVSEAMIYGVMCGDAFLLFAPDYIKGKLAGARIFKLIDRKPLIDMNSKGKQMENLKGEVSFKDVTFNYASRPTQNALNKVKFKVNPGESVAVVGKTGSGKSSLVSLLLRFYDPRDGGITLDDSDLRTFKLQNLRYHLSLVSQEPLLFNFSIAENIAYGDNTREVNMDDIIVAARAANIHEFIVSLPAGYDTKVGTLGSQLSGGQKQRVCIARALIRNPKLLVLDEATSALDTESESLVLGVLKNAQIGRTSITIAHRLSSIKKCDKIFVMKEGSVVEEGRHEELLASLDGSYYAMWYAQRSVKSHRHRSKT